MSIHKRGSLFAAIAALVVLGIGPPALANDDFATFNFQERVLVGSALLEPGSYTFRAVHVGQFMAVQVSNGDETTRYALFRARPEPLDVAAVAGGESFEVVPGENGVRRIVSWQLQEKKVRYVIEAGIE